VRIRKFIKNRDIVPLSEVLRWCKAQRRAAPENTPRHATYVLLIEVLEHLSHTRDITQIPAEKLVKLCAKACAHAGWSTKRPRPVPTTPLPSGHRHCPKCLEIKPDVQFLQQATDRQRMVYGWHAKRTVRWVMSPYCKRCRTAAVKRRRRREKTKLLVQNPHMALVVILREKVKTTRRALSTATAATSPAKDFYETKLRALSSAINTVEHLLDTSPDTPLPHASDWTQLLEENHRQALLNVHHQIILQRLPGRSPSL
jgi:hypothetical protein